MVDALLAALREYGAIGLILLLVAFILLNSRIVIEYRGWRSQEIGPAPKRKKLE